MTIDVDKTLAKTKQTVIFCFQNYAKFDGRAGLSEFWHWFLFAFTVSLILNAVWSKLAGLFGLIVLMPSLAVGARRLHDTNKSGWLQLLCAVPVIGIFVLIYLWAQPPVNDNNNFK